MRPVIFTAILLCVYVAATFSQATPIEGTIEYQKGEKRAAIVEIPFPPDVVEGAINEQLARSGVKEERFKGMQVFKNARITPTDGEVADLYFKVERKGRKEDNISRVYLIMGRPNENVSLRTSDDAYRIQDAKLFLSNLQPKTQSFQLETNIRKTDDNIKKSEVKLTDLQENRKRLDKKIQELEEELTRLKVEKESLIGKRAK